MEAIMQNRCIIRNVADTPTGTGRITSGVNKHPTMRSGIIIAHTGRDKNTDDGSDPYLLRSPQISSDGSVTSWTAIIITPPDKTEKTHGSSKI